MITMPALLIAASSGCNAVKRYFVDRHGPSVGPPKAGRRTRVLAAGNRTSSSVNKTPGKRRVPFLQNDARLSDRRRLWHGPSIDAANQRVETNIVRMVPPAIPHVDDEIE
jgi:hypothetical protein